MSTNTNRIQLVLAIGALTGAAGGQEVVKEWVALEGVSSFGTAVSARGDLDGDGVRDLVVSAWTTAPGAGVYAYSGATNALLWFVPAAAYSEKFGIALEHAGDIDLDGRADVLVGAPREPHDSGYGAVHVLSGADGSSLRIVTSSGDFAHYDAEFGSALAGAADVDGDGIPDLAVGAPGAGVPSARVGAAIVYSGANGSVLRQYSGSIHKQQLGTSLAFLETDGDARAELAIASLVLQSTPDAGAVAIHSGVANAVLTTIPAPVPTKAFGRAMCAIGDIDGDGADDLAIGSPFHSQAAATNKNVYLVSGANGAILFSFGESPDQLGSELAGGDDIDGDGIPDVLAGDPTATIDGVTNVGRAHAISGATGLEIWNYSDVTTGGMIGSAVAMIGDLRGDGRAESVVAAPLDEIGFVTSGRVRALSTVECGSVSHYGAACDDDFFFTPSLNLVGCPHSGATISMIVETSLPTTGLLVLGTQQAALPLPSGCTLHVALPLVVIGPFPIPGFGTGFELTGALPDMAAPFTFHSQAIVRKGPQSSIIDASRGLSVTIEP